MRLPVALLNILQVLIGLASSTDVEANGTLPMSKDNSCGMLVGWVCNPGDPLGGPCCSKSGWCGMSDAYCGEGCQEIYSSPGSCKTNMADPQAGDEGQDPNITSPTSTSSRHRHYTHTVQHTLQPLPEPAIVAGRSPPAKQEGDQWVVDGSGSFSNYAHFMFEGDSLPDGLYASQYNVDTPHTPFNHGFDPANVFVRDGYLQLRVPGGQTKNPVLGAEVGTTMGDILYASVRTVAMFSNVPGTCHGQFFYKSDTQEIDIEYLTDPRSLANPKDKCDIHFTNQATSGIRSDNSYRAAPAPADAATKLHEYRVDWTPYKVAFYVDGDLKQIFLSNIPNTPGSWLWNNWANGDPTWSANLPKEDNIFKISEVTMYFNRGQ